LIAAGTSLTTAGSAADGVAADDELEDDELDDPPEADELLLLLLPHPAAPATQSTAVAAAKTLLHVRI
jgi:hypothetical protein